MDQNEMICLERKCPRVLYILCACDNVYGLQWIHMKNVHKRCFFLNINRLCLMH